MTPKTEKLLYTDLFLALKGSEKCNCTRSQQKYLRNWLWQGAVVDAEFPHAYGFGCWGMELWGRALAVEFGTALIRMLHKI